MPKQFDIEGFNGTTEAWLKLSVGQLPAHAKSLGDETVSAREDNNAAGVYDVVLGSFTAADNHVWFDCCEFYRSFMASLSALPSTVKASPVLTDMVKKPSVVTTAIHVNVFALGRSGQPLYEDIARYHKILVTAMKGPHVDPLQANYIHFQNGLKPHMAEGNSPTVQNVGRDPEGQYGWDDGLEEALQSLAADMGTRCSAYTRPGDLYRDRGYTPEGSAYLKDRNGNNRTGPLDDGRTALAIDIHILGLWLTLMIY